MGIKFITSTKEFEQPLNYIRELGKYLDIEYTKNINRIKNSNKVCLIWNPVSEILFPEHKWKSKLWDYFKQHNKPIYAIERGYLPDCLYIDKNGVLPESSSYNEKNWNHSLIKKELDKVTTYINEFKTDSSTLEGQQSKRISKKQFNKKLKLDRSKRIVFVPLQKFNDTTILKWVGWIENMKKFKKMITKIAKQNPDIIILVKAHPCTPEDNIQTCENIINVDGFHYKDCIAYSDVILTINSGVGLQAMMWGKPVIITGNAFYWFYDINYRVHNVKEIVQLIYTIKKPNIIKVMRFIYFLKYNFYTDCKMGIDRKPIATQRIVFDHPHNNKQVEIIIE